MLGGVLEYERMGAYVCLCVLSTLRYGSGYWGGSVSDGCRNKCFLKVSCKGVGVRVGGGG